jgi:hypothetical protein
MRNRKPSAVATIVCFASLAGWPASRPAGSAQAPAQSAKRGQTLASVARAVRGGITAREVAAIVSRLVSFGTRSSISDAGGGTQGVGGARDWIAAQFRSFSAADGGRLQVALDSFDVPAGPRIPNPVTMTNVVATLPGDDPGDRRIFIVGGHYDSIASFPQDILNPKAPAPGANDDASGVAVVLECARLLSRYHFPATLRFIAFEGEEQGLFGSSHAAAAARKNGDDIAGMLDNDIVGGDNSPGRVNGLRVRLFSEGVPASADAAEIRMLEAVGGENDSPSRELARYIAEYARRYLQATSPSAGARRSAAPEVVLEFRRDRFLRGGDHFSYNRSGYAAVRFTDYYENYHHQHQTPRTENGIVYGDLQRFTTPAFNAGVARINAIALAALASTPPPPADVRFAPTLQTATTLSWQAVPGVAVYRVLLRPTAASQWQRRIVVHGTTVTIPQSKDNYIMAVASVGPGGNEGLPALPSLHRRGPPGTR